MRKDHGEVAVAPILDGRLRAKWDSTAPVRLRGIKPIANELSRASGSGIAWKPEFNLFFPVSDRLKELQHQRTLLLEQLAWLDREIAAANSTTNTPALETAPLVTKRPLATEVAHPIPASFDRNAAEIAAEEIIAHYKKESESLQGTVKRGCFLYFFIALALLGLGLLALYLFRTNR